MATKLYTQLVGGGEPIEELPADIIKYTYRLNGIGTLDFQLSLDHEKAIKDNVAINEHEVVIERNGVVVWVGPLLQLNEDDSSRMLNFSGQSLEHFLTRWHITSTLDYSSVTGPAVAWNLLNHHQAKAGGDFGITNGTTVAGPTRDRTYLGFEDKQVWEAVSELAAVDGGFDFYIDPATRAFTTYYPNKGKTTEYVYDDRNIRRFGRSIDGTLTTSQVLASGAGDGTSMLKISRQDSAAVAAYGLLQTPYVNKDVKRSTTLQGHADLVLSTYKQPTEVISIVAGVTDPDLFQAHLGDRVRVKWESPYHNVNKLVRIVGIDVTWSQGEEQVVYLFDEG